MKIKEATQPTNSGINDVTQIINVTTLDVRERRNDGSVGDIIDTFEVKEIEDGDNFYYEFLLPDSKVVQLREMTGRDRVWLQGLSSASEGQLSPLELMYRMVTRLCVRWGDDTSVDYEYFMGLSHRKLRPIERRIEALIAQFFRD